MKDYNEIIIHDDYAEIVLCNGNGEEIARALIDIEDVNRCKNHKWYLNSFGCVYNNRVGLLHRFLMNNPFNSIVDFINGYSLDNRRCNLRIYSDNMSQIKKGCYYLKNKGKWVAYIMISDRYKCLGYFDNEEKAAEAYDKEAIKLFGIYANLNFPIENYYNYIIDLGLNPNDFNIDDNK